MVSFFWVKGRSLRIKTRQLAAFLAGKEVEGFILTGMYCIREWQMATKLPKVASKDKEGKCMDIFQG